MNSIFEANDLKELSLVPQVFEDLGLRVDEAANLAVTSASAQWSSLRKKKC